MSGVPLSGRATPAGTRRGAESFGAGARTLGRTGLTVSPVGFGGYRVAVDMPLHRRALADALRGGANLIDTSTNYADGRSEALVGTMLANLVQQGEVKREQIVVVSKVGYLQNSNLESVRARQPPQPEIVEYGPGLWHCIHPEFITSQLDASLQRLGLAHLDVLLLHNPEYFLADAAKRSDGDQADVQARFDDRLRRAFERLEALVAAGKIGWYGVSSNGFVEPWSRSTATSLRRMVALAQEVGGAEHHFAVVQMPMNLFELGAVSSVRDDEPPAIRLAAEHDLGVLTNRPLNASFDRDGAAKLVRLADAPAAERQGFEEARRVLADVRKLEAKWATGLGKRLKIDDDSDAVDLFRWGQELGPRLDALSLEQWSKLRHEVIAVHLGRTSAALLGALQGEAKAEFSTWWASYGTTLHQAFEAIEAGLRSRRRDLAQRVAEAVDPLLPQPWRSLPLSQKAVLTVLCAEVSCVLVGMRQPGYVHDILALRDEPVRLLSAGVGPVDFAALRRAVAGLTL